MSVIYTTSTKKKKKKEVLYLLYRLYFVKNSHLPTLTLIDLLNGYTFSSKGLRSIICCTMSLR